MGLMLEPADIKAAAKRLESGGLVAFPTETVYGLGAAAKSAEAVARVYETKGRPSNNPLIVHCSDEAMASACAASWPEAAKKAAAAFWPGPLTLVVERAASIPDIVTAGGGTLAVRVPDHPVAVALIEAFGGPIVGPSANPSGYISPTTADHVRASFTEDQVLVLDGGPCRAGLESTVLDLTGEKPTILRRGVIGTEELTPVLGEVLVAEHALGAAAPTEAGEAGEAMRSPGVLGPHYKPRAPVTLVEDISTISRVVSDAGGKVALLGPPGQRVRIGSPHLGVDMPGLASGYARELYAGLRRADESEPALIVVVFPLLKDSEVWDAIRERLRRAAADTPEA